MSRERSPTANAQAAAGDGWRLSPPPGSSCRRNRRAASDDRTARIRPGRGVVQFQLLTGAQLHAVTVLEGVGVRRLRPPVSSDTAVYELCPVLHEPGGWGEDPPVRCPFEAQHRQADG